MYSISWTTVSIQQETYNGYVNNVIWEGTGELELRVNVTLRDKFKQINSYSS